MVKVIVHNTVSLDGAIIGFDVDMGLHYQVAGAFGPQAYLIGADTARRGIEMFGAPPETEQTRIPPKIDPADTRPLWVIVDSQGRCEGLLHAFRASGYCRDVAVLTSARTPKRYLGYLDERGYAHWQAGDDRVNLPQAMQVLEEQGIKTVLVDSGPGLVSALFAANLVTDLSLIIAPRIVGANAPRLLSTTTASLTLRRHTEHPGGHLALLYGVLRPSR